LRRVSPSGIEGLRRREEDHLVRIARFLLDKSPITGRLEGNLLHPFPGDALEELQKTGPPIPVERAAILAPCRPGKIVAVGLNYRDHALERSKPLPAEPLIFLKPPSAALAPGGTILLPPGVGRVDHEAELAIVIGRQARHLAPADAAKAILGYTCFNDVTARELQDREIQFTRAKGYDTFAPFGPWIETEMDPSDLSVSGSVNGVVRQSSRTRELIFPPAVLVAFISRVMTLYPGDIVATGTPAGIGPLAAGDRVEVSIEGIGTLANSVAAADRG
jgi:2-keto-4-pentenoate hydratase/2-oxohepta-3-ene-1,7-dioic acid hydratase in catechol pathway